MRINKYIASAGVCSRRKADELIANGNVKINGEVVTHLGTDVGEYDVVEVNGRKIKSEGKKAVSYTHLLVLVAGQLLVTWVIGRRMRRESLIDRIRNE